MTLIATPATLPLLSVTTKSLSCPADEDFRADSIWRSPAAKYQTVMTGLALGYEGGSAEESVSSDGRGYGDTPLLPNRSGGRNFLSNANALNAPPPYALYERHVGLTGEFWRWRYAPLEDLGGHFVSSVFRSGHTLHQLGTAGDEIVLGFCPNEKREADIEGELVINARGELRSARWAVRVTHDDEGAGGEANFVRTSFENSTVLIGVRGATWRRATNTLFNQERFEKVSWSLRRLSPQ